MSELLVIAFRDQYRASEVLNDLQRREWDWVVELDQAVVVRMNQQSELRVLFSVDPTTYQGAAWARMWSSFLRLVMSVKVTNGLTAAAREMGGARDSQVEDPFDPNGSSADVAWWRERNCGPQQFIRDVGALIRPGNSTLFVLLRTSESAAVLNRLRDYSSTILHAPLSQEQDEQLMVLLAQRLNT